MSFGDTYNFPQRVDLHAQASYDTELSQSVWSDWQRCSRPLQLPSDVAQLEHDRQGNVTQMTTTDGVIYQYSQFGCDGQPTVCKITDSKTGDWGQWRQESEGIWRSYHRDKPNYEILRGRWTVDEFGKMHMDGEQDTAPLPRQHKKIGPGPSGVPDSPPDGYHYMRGKVPPEAVQEAWSLISGAYGTETPFQVDGKQYMARVEPHYHSPESGRRPTGWHKGVTVYEANTR
jgi:hypothetical protein